MQANNPSLGTQAFGEDASLLINVKYGSHHDALKQLQSALREPNGIGLLQGPTGSGKTTVVRELVTQLSPDAVIALIDGTHLKPRRLLTGILSQFGVETDTEADDQLLKQIGDLASQETRSYQPPILIIDNVDRMYPSALRLVNLLAMLTVLQRYSFRMILTGHEGLNSLVESGGMTDIAARNPVSYSLQPLTPKETMIYLHARLQAAGSDRAETVFPFDVCDRLREQSGGWPGPMNQFALEAMQRASSFPVSVVNTYSKESAKVRVPKQDIPVLGVPATSKKLPPRLIVTRDGSLLHEYTFKEKKVLIGRSDFADIMVDDDFVSKIHAVLLLYSDALVLLDLNSANGTTVNSVKVKKTILKTDDIITLGHHRLKVENAPVVSKEMESLLKSPDTLKMRNLVHMRRLHAQRSAMTLVRGKKQD